MKKKLIAWMLKDEDGYTNEIFFKKKQASEEKIKMENDWDIYYKVIKVEIKEIK
jgi:hypothetical protein